MKFLAICLFVVTSIVGSGCSKVVVREARVYKAELDFIGEANEEVVANAKALLEKKCVCSTVGDGFSDKECQALAETILVLDARMGYHLEMMLYLADLSKERPSKDAPEIAEVNSLCKEK